MARWVGLNRIAELELARAWPAPGRRSGIVRMAGRRWRWEERVLPTESPDLRRVELTVRPEDAPRGVRVRLVAFLGRPLRAPPADEGGHEGVRARNAAHPPPRGLHAARAARRRGGFALLAALAYGAIRALPAPAAAGSPRRLAAACLALLAAKLAWEACCGALPASEALTGGPVHVAAHRDGALGGLLAALAAAARTRHRR